MLSLTPSYSRLGQQQLAGPAPWPVDAPKALVSVHMPAQRLPLLATVGGVQSASPPQGWLQRKPDPRAVAALFPLFRQQVPVVDACMPNGEWVKGYPLRRLDVQLQTQWQDRHGNQLIALQVRPEVSSHCDGPKTYASQLWFYRPAHGRPQLLPDQPANDGFDGLPFRVVAVVDLDGQGQPGFLLMRSGYNRYGYALYQPGQRVMPQFLVTFH